MESVWGAIIVLVVAFCGIALLDKATRSRFLNSIKETAEKFKYKKSISIYMHSAITKAVYEKVMEEIEKREGTELLDEITIFQNDVRLSYLTGKVISKNGNYEVVTSDYFIALQELGCQGFSDYDNELYFATALAKMLKADGTEYIVTERKIEEGRIYDTCAPVIQSKYACLVGRELCRLHKEEIKPRNKSGFFWYEDE